MNQIRDWRLVAILFLSLLAGCGDQEKGETAYANACGGCHLLPDPAHLPGNTWSQTTLPEMAARLGFSINGYDPYEGLSWQDQNLVARTGAYPEQPTISAEDFEALYRYILSQAPDQFPRENRKEKIAPITQFDPEFIHIDQRRAAQTTFLAYDKSDQTFKVGNISGFLLSLTEGRQDTLANTYSPVVAWSGNQEKGILGDIGILPPTQMLEGELNQMDGSKLTLLSRNLHRPVHLLLEDLNADGQDEIVVCEYGDYSGQLTLITESPDSGVSETALLEVPGSIRCMARDMNQDGMKDLIVVMGQGNEGVFLLYQEKNLSFRPEQVIQCHAVYGSSWMELTDMDGDGDDDIVLAHGDNADFSPVLKPYHGIRIYLNDGNNHFEEAWFYPIHGATRVVAEDFDEDGDVDLAVCAYFPDFQHHPEASFVYLEHGGNSLFDYHPMTIPEAKSGRWITADAGDYDHDGDLDILLGSFTHTPTPVPMEIQDIWNESGPDILLLRNQLASK